MLNSYSNGVCFKCMIQRKKQVLPPCTAMLIMTSQAYSHGVVLVGKSALTVTRNVFANNLRPHNLADSSLRQFVICSVVNIELHYWRISMHRCLFYYIVNVYAT